MIKIKKYFNVFCCRNSTVCSLLFLLVVTINHPVSAQIKALEKSEKHRILLLTDIGGDRDDEQSFTHFMMYADQYDIEGLIATSIRIFPKEKHRPIDGEPQPQYLVRFIDAYAKVRENLLKHSGGWPEPDALKSVIRKGVITGRDAPFDIRAGKAGEGSGHYPLSKLIGKGKDSDATQLIIDVVDKDDSRPVWVPIWGGSVELAQALWRVRNERSKAELQKFVSKLRVYAWGHQDATGLWIQENFPELYYLVSTGGIIYASEAHYQSKEWLDEHVRFNHGPLGALCPIRWGKFGGADSETFLGLIPNGLSNMERPDWGGWGGRLRRAPGSKSQWVDLEVNLNRDHLGGTISRWAPHFLNDLQARLDWSVKEFKDANHPPHPVVNGDSTRATLEISAKPGQRITLDGSGSSDIDKDKLSYTWRYYPEAGNYLGWIDINKPNKKRSSFDVPKDAAGTNIHILLILTDNGAPALTRYRRLVINVK